MLDLVNWLVVAGLAAAMVPLWISALAKGIALHEELHRLAAWINMREVDYWLAQRETVLRWLLNATGLIAGAVIIQGWAATQGLGIYAAGASIAVWVLIAGMLGYALPLGLGKKHSARLAPTVNGIVRGLSLILYPLLWLAMKISQAGGLTTSEMGHTHGKLTDEDLRALAHVAGADNGTIEKEERDMIAGVFQLGNALAREVMVPRPDIVAVDADTPMLEALSTVIRAGHSRIPVYQGNIDNIIGILYAKDLLSYLRDGNTAVSLSKTIRDAYFVPESKAADTLLQELQQLRTHIAIVVDEYGGVAGLVTIEDLLEEIVGEIRDEYDMAEEPLIEVITPFEVICNARIDLDDLNRQFSLSLPTEESDSLGGLIYSRLGRIPEVGDTITVEGVEATVLDIEGQRITKVKVILPSPDTEPPPPSSSETKPNQRRTSVENASNLLTTIMNILA